MEGRTMNTERIYAQIDLSALRANAITVHELGKDDTGMIPVIKANAYGHGAGACAMALAGLPFVKGFAVAAAYEALMLRSQGVTQKILMLGHAMPSEVQELISRRIVIPVSGYEAAENLSQQAVRLGMPALTAIAVDTGMHRIGFRPDEESAAVIEKIAALPGIVMDTMFTHYAKADEEDPEPARRQLAAFRAFHERLSAAGVRFEDVHASNSAAGIRMREEGMDAVRLGILLYGLMPSDVIARMIAEEGIDIRPVMSIRSQIVHLQRLEAGDAVGYGGTYVAKEQRVIATVPAGYADGYPRSMSGKGEVLVHGKRVPITGRVCMDQFMADVTDIPDIAVGDEVVLLGTQGTETITAEELAEVSGRFNYEIPCLITDRVKRIYTG